MAVTFRNTTAQRATVAKPTGTVEGDLLVAFHTSWTDGTAAGMTAPAGWSQVGATLTIPDTGQLKLWWKAAGAAEPADYTFTNNSPTNSGLVQLTAITGHEPSSPFSTDLTFNSSGTTTTSHPAPSLSIPVDGGVLLCGWNSSPTTGGTDPEYTGLPLGMSQLRNQAVIAVGASGGLFLYVAQEPEDTGTSGTRTPTAARSATFGAFSLGIRVLGAVTPVPVFADLDAIDVEVGVFAPTLEYVAAPDAIDVAVELLLAEAIESDVDPAPVDIEAEPLPVTITATTDAPDVEVVTVFLNVVAEHVVNLAPIDVTIELPGLTGHKHIDLGALDHEVDPAPVGLERTVYPSWIPVEVEFIAPSVGFYDFDALDTTVELLPVVVGLAADVTAAQRGSQTVPPGEGTRVIAQSILTGQWLHWELPVDELKVTHTLSGPTVIAGVFKPWVEDLEDLGIDRWATWFHVEDNDIIRASGVLMSGDEDPNTGQVSFEALGVTAYPHEGWFEGIYSQIGIDPADIVRYLWQVFQTAPDRNLGVTVHGTTPVRLGTEPAEEVEFETGEGEQVSFEKGGPYSLSWWDNVNFGEEIDDLAKETPFDYIERPAWNATRTAVVQRVELGYPRLGTRQRNLLFSPDANVITTSEVGETEKAYASQVIVLGAGEGRSMIRGYAGTRIGSRIGRQIVIVDNKIDTKTRADARAREELARANAARFTLEQIEVDARHENAPWGSYQVGDDIQVGPLDLPHNRTVHLWCRIISATYAPASDSVLLELIPTEAANYTGAATG